MLHKVIPNDIGFQLCKDHKITKGSGGLLEKNWEDIQLRRGKHMDILNEFPRLKDIGISLFLVPWTGTQGVC